MHLWKSDRPDSLEVESPNDIHLPGVSMHEEMNFDGRVAVITGAGRGIGREYAKYLAQRGASILVNDFGGEPDGNGSDAVPAEAVAMEIDRNGGTAVANTGSVASEEGAAAIIAATIDTFGRIDILVNNAGITEGAWDALIATNLSGTFWMCKAAWPYMIQQNHGRIVNTASAAGLFGLRHETLHGLEFYGYGAAKMGVVGLTRNLAIEGRPQGIMVNVIAPVAQSRLTDLNPDPVAHIWLKKYFHAKHIAPLVVALSHESCSLSGQIFAVGGGRVGRVFVGETLGLSSDQLSPESIVDGMEEIFFDGGYIVPEDTLHETQIFDQMRRKQLESEALTTDTLLESRRSEAV